MRASRIAAASAAGVALLLLAVGCCSPSARGPDLVKAHAAALERAAAGRAAAPAAATDVEPAAVARFIAFYREYSADVIRRDVRNVYAADAYFGDPFKSVTGIDAIEAYFLKMAEPVESCTFEVTGAHRDASGDYFLPWVMTLTVKAAKKSPLRALGLSHVRFDGEGKVVFQQDYWDSSPLFERLPVVGPLTRYIKGRMEK